MSRQPGAEDKNPYLPKYIQNAPWYLGERTDYLEHHKSTTKKVEPQWYDKRGVKKNAATKYRKGACTNCGSMSHKASDCMERPRKVGAKYSGKDIMPDEEVQSIETTWESKRDRWNGYDPREYGRVIEDFESVEKLRAKAAAEGGSSSQGNGDNDGTGIEDDDDGEKVPGGDDMPQSKSLRARNDKAKYLENLNDDDEVTGTLFNPKSRTMRTEDSYLDDRGHYVKNLSGEAAEHNRITELARKMAEKEGSPLLNVEANPTAAMMKLRKLEQGEQEKATKKRQELLEKYGGQEHLERPKELGVQPLTQEQVASRGGDLGKIKPAGAGVRSRYPEDVYPGNHSSVWGSYWQDHKWGYKCCGQLVKNAYCTAKRKHDHITN